MSWENEVCPCGGKKERETLLCSPCQSDLAHHPAMRAFNFDNEASSYRRSAAIILVTLARKITRKGAV